MTSTPNPTPQQIRAMRRWVDDCSGGFKESREELAALPDAEILDGVDRFYLGVHGDGVAGFLADTEE